MPAFVWITNHRMWKVVAPFSESFDVLKAYITDPSAYVYWSTPRHIDEIKPGDTAYIFRSVDRAGIVARGVVEEAPRHLSAASAASFAFPARLTPPVVAQRPVGVALEPSLGVPVGLAVANQ